MSYIFTFFWSFLLITMLNYVVGSIAAVPFQFAEGAIVSVIFAIAVIVISESMPKGPVTDH